MRERANRRGKGPARIRGLRWLAPAVAFVLLCLPLPALAQYTQPFSLGGTVGAQYVLLFGDVPTTDSLDMDLRLYADGFYLDPRLLNYNADLFVAGSLTGEGDVSYNLDARASILELSPVSPWKLRRLPHPLTLRYSHYSTGKSSGTGYGLGLSWHLPVFLRFFEKDRFVRMAATPGRRERTEKREDVKDLWNVGNPGNFGNLDQQLGNEGWGQQQQQWQMEDDLGPTGWGNRTGQWDQQRSAQQNETGARREGPLFSIPFPFMGFSYDHSDYDTTGVEESNDTFGFNLTMNDLNYRFSGSFSHRIRDRSDLSEADQRTVGSLYHVYDPPPEQTETRVTDWSVRNQLRAHSIGSGVFTHTSSVGYGLSGRWQRRNLPDRTELTAGSYFSFDSTDESQLYAVGVDGSYGKRFSPALNLEGFALLNYQDRSTDVVSEQRLGGLVEWNFSRIAMMEAAFSFDNSTSLRASDRGGYGYSARLGSRLHHRRLNGGLRGSFSQRNLKGFVNTFFEGSADLSGTVFATTLQGTAAATREELNAADGTTVRDIQTYNLSLNRIFFRISLLSMGATYRAVVDDNPGGRSRLEIYNAQATSTTLLTSRARLELRAGWNREGSREFTYLSANPTYTYARGRFLAKASYDLGYRSTNSSGSSLAHTLVLTVSRAFGGPPSGY